MNESPYNALSATGYVPLTLSIGVAGHRKLAASQRTKHEQDIVAVYKVVLQTLENLHEHAVDIGISCEDMTPIVRLVSSVAEGADRLLVAPGLAPEDAQLVCVLPFAKDDYAQDFLPERSVYNGDSLAEYEALLKRAGFGTPESRVLELTDTAGGRSDGYRRAGVIVVSHSDLLIALFDGHENDAGGTWSTVLEARRCGLPIIVIDAAGAHAPRLWTRSATSGQYEPERLTVQALEDPLRSALVLNSGGRGEADGDATRA